MAGKSLSASPCRDVSAQRVGPLLRSSVTKVKLKTLQSLLVELQANQFLYCSRKVRFFQSNLTTFRIEPQAFAYLVLVSLHY